MIVESKVKKSRTVSFRIPEDMISEIEKEAKTNLTSTNILVNQILHYYVTWERHRQKMKMYPVSEEILRDIMNNTKDSQMNNVVDLVFNFIRELALITKKEFDLNSSIQVMKEYCNTFGISFDDSETSEKHIFTIRHNMGKNFSLLFEKLFERIIWDFKKEKIECESTKSCIVIKTKKF